MKPFFSIRIEWNPADSDDESARDSFSVKRSVARQCEPAPKFSTDTKKLADLLQEDTSNVVQAIVSCVEDLGREAKWTLPNLVSDIVFDLANADSLEEHITNMAEIAMDGCSDAFLDSLQKLIDRERNKAARP